MVCSSLKKNGGNPSPVNHGLCPFNDRIKENKNDLFTHRSMISHGIHQLYEKTVEEIPQQLFESLEMSINGNSFRAEIN